MRKYDVISIFQDGSRGGLILLPGLHHSVPNGLYSIWNDIMLQSTHVCSSIFSHTNLAPRPLKGADTWRIKLHDLSGTFDQFW